MELSEEDADVEQRLDDARKLLVVTHDDKAEMWHVDYVGKKHGSDLLKAADVDTGCLTVRSDERKFQSCGARTGVCINIFALICKGDVVPVAP